MKVQLLTVVCLGIMLSGCERRISNAEECLESIMVAGAAGDVAGLLSPEVKGTMVGAAEYYADAVAAETGRQSAEVVQAAAGRAVRALDTEDGYKAQIETGRRCLTQYIEQL